MHKGLPSLFIFLDKYNNEVFKNNGKNIGIIYRNYNSVKNEKDIVKIAKNCKKKRYQLFISNDIKLVVKVKANGLYIPAFNKTKILCNFEKKIKIIGSAHSQIEIKEKINQKCEGIFISPIFKINKSKKHLGIHKFNFLSKNNNVSSFALGGINEKNYSKLKMLRINGFGGISFFKKKTGLKRPVFLKNIFFRLS